MPKDGAKELLSASGIAPPATTNQRKASELLGVMKLDSNYPERNMYLWDSRQAFNVMGCFRG